MEYFVADLHFGHKNIVSFERSKFETVLQHDDYILRMLSQFVHPDDVLYILGDFGNLDDDRSEVFRKFKFKKVFVYGNHDEKNEEFYRNRYGFDEIYKHPLYLTSRIVVSHIPVPVEPGVINVHGHLHNSDLEMKNYINVNIHRIDYQPRSMKKIKKYLGSLKKDSIKFLEEWYAPYYVFDEEKDDLYTYEYNGKYHIDEARLEDSKEILNRKRIVLAYLREQGIDTRSYTSKQLLDLYEESLNK